MLRGVPELPEMQALAERLDAAISGRTLLGYRLLGFTSLKTVEPRPDELIGSTISGVGRRGKYLVLSLATGYRLVVHLSQAGRLDVEDPPKATTPRGSVVRLELSGGLALLVREHGTQRKAAWWVLAPGNDGPLVDLGPDPFDDAFDDWVDTSNTGRHVHTALRDQHEVAGIGRGYADDALNRAGISPFSSLRSLDAPARQRLVSAVRAVLSEALDAERRRTGGLSPARLGDRFAVHNRAGQPCPRCGAALQRVSYDSYEIVYCAACQTKGRTLADRRLSRLLK